MSLKSRLKMSFLIIILLPIMLVVTTGRVILQYQVNSIEQTYKMDLNTLQMITNPIQVLNRVTSDIFNRIKYYAVSSPGLLEKETIIEELNEELKQKYSFLVVMKGEEVVFKGNAIKFYYLEKNMKSMGEYSTSVDGGFYVGGKNPFLVKQQDFHYTDGTKGTIYIVTDVNTMVPQIKRSIIQSIICFILIIFLTASILIIWLYRGIIHPLNILKRATNEMRDGNLDYAVHIKSTDEIGQLCEDFEQMRVHMKELLEVKMQYETNSRELLSNISHDLKTPITTIKGYSEGIIDGVADTPEKLDRYIKTIYTKANDMSSLVDELSMFAKLDANALPYNFTAVSADRFFTDFIEEMGFELEVKNIELIYENNMERDCKIVIDTEQMRRVIHNILDNSVKYMDKAKGVITVKIADNKNQILVEIKDNGCGIKKDSLPYIFDRFYRADPSRNSRKGGSGLGLAIVKKIVIEHGGTIDAKSVYGEGTSIYFTIMKQKEGENKNE